MPEQFLEASRRSNEAEWPAQWVLLGLALAAVIAVANGTAHEGLTHGAVASGAPMPEALVVRAGCMLLVLPPYSPDFNLTEPAWNARRQILRGISARTVEALHAALTRLGDAITADDGRVLAEGPPAVLVQNAAVRGHFLREFSAPTCALPPLGAVGREKLRIGNGPANG